MMAINDRYELKDNGTINYKTNVSIIRKSDKVEIFSYVINEDDDEDNDVNYHLRNIFNSATFFLNDNVDFVIVNDQTEDYFPNATIINLETLETKYINHMMKYGYKTAEILDDNKTILLTGYIMGMINGSISYDFDGNTKE